MTDYIAGFEDHLLNELGRKRSTVEAYKERIAWWERWTGKRIEDVTTDDMRRLKRERPLSYKGTPLSGSYCKGLIVTMHQFHIWGSLEGYWTKNGICDVRTSGPWDTEESSPPLPVSECVVLMDACRRPLEYRLIYYGCYLGTRIGESAIIDGPMWQDGFVRFRGEKNGRMREVPVNPELEAVKWHLWASRPTDDSTLQRVKRRLEERTGIDFVAHQLRKTFSTLVHEGGASMLCRRDLLGHSLGLDGIYTEVGKPEKVAAVMPVSYRQRVAVSA